MTSVPTDDDVEIEIAEIEGDRFVILSWPVLPTTNLPQLTIAEEEVLKALTRGLSNAEIAEARSTSVRTIANQVASLLRKFNVTSRHELIVKLAHGGDASGGGALEK